MDVTLSPSLSISLAEPRTTSLCAWLFILLDVDLCVTFFVYCCCLTLCGQVSVSLSECVLLNYVGNQMFIS